jgi:hypothetical protein
MLQTDADPKLHLLVYDSSRELCRVAMPIASLENLEHLFPDEDLKVVKALGVNFPRIIEAAQKSGLVPQTLIDTQTPARSYRIWIE